MSRRPCSTRIRIPRVQPIAANSRYGRAIRAVADLLTRLRAGFVFVGSVARSAYVGGLVNGAAIDVIAAVSSEQKGQVAMMASHRGFRVDRAETEASEELDLVPLKFIDPEGDVRVHVLVASNALYGRMVAEGVETAFEELAVRVPRPEDYAILLQMSGDLSALEIVARSPEFDRASYNRKVESIGLRELVIPE
jgi:hypothetical protein